MTGPLRWQARRPAAPLRRAAGALLSLAWLGGALVVASEVVSSAQSFGLPAVVIGLVASVAVVLPWVWGNLPTRVEWLLDGALLQVRDGVQRPTIDLRIAELRWSRRFDYCVGVVGTNLELLVAGAPVLRASFSPLAGLSRFSRAATTWVGDELPDDAMEALVDASHAGANVGAAPGVTSLRVHVAGYGGWGHVSSFEALLWMAPLIGVVVGAHGLLVGSLGEARHPGWDLSSLAMLPLVTLLGYVHYRIARGRVVMLSLVGDRVVLAEAAGRVIASARIADMRSVEGTHRVARGRWGTTAYRTVTFEWPTLRRRFLVWGSNAPDGLQRPRGPRISGMIGAAESGPLRELLARLAPRPVVRDAAARDEHEREDRVEQRRQHGR